MSICDEYRERIREIEEEITRIKAWPSVDIPTAAKDRQEIERLRRKLENYKDKYERSLKRGGC